MPQSQSTVSVMNSFTGGLKTEFTGLNFPENACTDTDNCIFTLIGDVVRRPGIDYETNYSTSLLNRLEAISSFVWTNAGGDGNSKLYVLHTGNVLSFYDITNSTSASPLSAKKLSSVIDLSAFISGGPFGADHYECQFASGNGYLFVFNQATDPVICTYLGGLVTATSISIKVRDLEGISETGIDDADRSGVLTTNHHYNLLNQGWGGNSASLPSGGTGGGGEGA